MIEIPFNPVAFQIGPVAVRWYGMFLALAVLWLIIWAWWQVRRGAKVSLDTIFTLALVGIPSGVIFARLLHVVDNIVVAKLHPELALSGQVFDYSTNWARVIGGEGLTAWGAVLGASLGIWIYCKITKVKIGYIFDLLAPGIITAQAIGRVGCLFNGCCPGVETTAPWGLAYTNPYSPGFRTGVTQPAVVYEIFYNLIVFGILLKLRGKLKPDGSLYVLYLALYSAWRVVIDFWRAGSPFLFGLHQAQIIGIIILAVALPWMIIKTRFVKPAPVTSDTKNETAGSETTPPSA